MPYFAEVSPEDIEYYLRRSSESTATISVSKEFKVPFDPDVKRRFVYKQFESSEALEVVELKDEMVLSSSPAGRNQVKVTVFQNDGGRISFVIQQYKGKHLKPVTGMSLSFYRGEWQELLTFLGKLRIIDFSNPSNFWLNQNETSQPEALSEDDKVIVDKIKSLKGSDRSAFLEHLLNESSFTDEDLNVISGRRAGLGLFRQQLYDNNNWNENDWQNFFQENQWIFGYGLDYRFNGILQREAAVSDVDVDGKNTVRADFLLGATDFTTIVEMKLPNTEIFRGNKPNRSRTWALSYDLLDAVSQILTQKAEWQVKARNTNYDSEGNKVQQTAADPKAILILGNRDLIKGVDRELQIKLNTFEMYRRDSRNIEILTYDELFDRAFYVVHQRLPVAADRRPVGK